MEASYLASTKEALDYFQVSEQSGLTDSQVRQSTENYGRNGMLGLGKRTGAKLIKHHSSTRGPTNAIVETCT